MKFGCRPTGDTVTIKLNAKNFLVRNFPEIGSHNFGLYSIKTNSYIDILFIVMIVFNPLISEYVGKMFGLSSTYFG